MVVALAIMAVGGVADQIWLLTVVWWRAGARWALIGGRAHGEDVKVNMFFFLKN